MPWQDISTLSLLFWSRGYFFSYVITQKRICKLVFPHKPGVANICVLLGGKCILIHLKSKIIKCIVNAHFAHGFANVVSTFHIILYIKCMRHLWHVFN